MTVSETIVKFTGVGFALCPILWGHKGPTMSGWQSKDLAFESLEDFGNILREETNLGLLHRWSGTCAIDIDDLEVAHKWLLRHDVDLKQLLARSDAVRITSPTCNRGKLLYRLPEDIEFIPSVQVNSNHKEIDGNIQGEKSRAIIDFRNSNAKGTSVQDVIYGAHPDKEGKIDGMYGIAGDINNIPVIPKNLLHVWLSINKEKEKRCERNANAFTELDEAQEKQVREILQHIPADCNRDDWVTVCYALASMESDGWNVFKAWSMQSNKWDEREAKRLFNNANPHGGVTIGSIIFIAKRYGYTGTFMTNDKKQVVEDVKESSIYKALEKLKQDIKGR